jgi:hypothetical protein
VPQGAEIVVLYGAPSTKGPFAMQAAAQLALAASRVVAVARVHQSGPDAKFSVVFPIAD